MKRLGSLPALAAAGLLLGACAGPPAATPGDEATSVVATAPEPVAVEPATAPAQPTTAEAVGPEAALDFGPTDPATVQLAAGRPQLVEFYADW
jgi:hypothetical protein